MIAAFLLATLLVGDPVVRVEVVPAAVEVGEPFRCTLELEVDAEQVLDRPFDESAAFDDTWAVLDVRREAPRRGTPSGSTERAVTRWTWTVASLEPGERSLVDAFLVPLGVVGSLGGDPPAPIVVTSVLAAEETGPRPLVGFPEDLTLGGSVLARSRWFVPGLVAAALLVALLGAWLLVRRRGRAVPAAGVQPLPERVAALDLARRNRASITELRAASYDLTALLREAVDARTGSAAPGRTDEEWLARVLEESRVDATVREGLSSLFGRTARIKYAGERPSEFALVELERDAADLFERLLGAERGAAA